MKVKYYNYKQAVALSERFQELVGKPFDKDNEENQVKQVTIAPYSRIIQWQFVRAITHGVSLEEALTLCVNKRYDVIVIASKLKNNEGGFHIKSLSSYLTEHNLSDKLTQAHQ